METRPLFDTIGSQPLPDEHNPVLLYLNRLAPGSRRTQQVALDRIAALVTGGRVAALALSWHRLTGRQTQAIRSELATHYAPTTTNRMLAALRGVLKEAWRGGLLDAEGYHRAVEVVNVPWSTSPGGRTLSSGEMHALFAACFSDESPAGVRDTALLTVMYGGGLRRSEVVALDVSDYDPASGALMIRSTQAAQERVVHATNGGAAALNKWIAIRGTVAGPLFVPINKAQKITVRDRRMQEQSIYAAILKRGRQAKVTAFSCQDLRRTFIAELLESGAELATVQHLAGHCSVTTTQRYDRRREPPRRGPARMLHVPIPASS